MGRDTAEFIAQNLRDQIYLIRNTFRFTCLIESAGQKILCTFLNRLFAYKGFTLNKCNLFGKLGCSNFLINYKLLRYFLGNPSFCSTFRNASMRIISLILLINNYCRYSNFNCLHQMYATILYSIYWKNFKIYALSWIT